MGLIKAATTAVTSILNEQWREFFCCESIPANVLAVKGRRRTGANTANTKNTDNIITNGSVIVVNEGQCMMIVDQGQIVEFTAEAVAPYTPISKAKKNCWRHQSKAR